MGEVVGLLRVKRPNTGVFNRAVLIADDCARVIALGLQRDHCEAHQTAIVLQPHEFGGVGRDQPLIGQREVEGEEEGQDDEDRDQAEARKRKAPSRTFDVVSLLAMGRALPRAR
jgi:hypothetical protein